MPFYKDRPNGNKQRRNHANEGSWDDEGTHYRNNDGRRNGAGEHNPSKSFGGKKPYGPRGDGEKRPYGDHRSYAPKAEGDRKSYGDRRPFGPRAEGERRYGGPRPEGERRPYGGPRPEGERRPYGGPRPEGERRGPRFEDRPQPPRPERNEHSFRDYEYTAPVEARPVPEADMPRDNLLVGRNPIREALKSGRDIEKLMIQRGELSGSAREIVAEAKAAHIVVQEVDKVRLDEIAPHHQGMIAFASAYQYATLEEILAVAEERQEAPFIILLDGVTDPHNLGAVIRTSECVGAHGVIVPERRSVGLTPAAVKASAGAVEHIKVARVVNINRTIEELKARNIWAYAVTMDGQDYLKTDFTGGVALVIGAEGEGISRLTLDSCDVKVSLPMEGVLDSLNASVAAGVMMYRVLASRKA